VGRTFGRFTRPIEIADGNCYHENGLINKNLKRATSVMKKFLTILLTLACILGLAGCVQEEKATENQILKLSFELNNETHTYTIEYDSDNNIVKVDNTDYYEFLEDGELITDVTILDTELTDYFIRNGGSSK
jgi:hypothetical protein